MKITKQALKTLNKMPKKTAGAFYAAFDRIDANDLTGLDIKKMAGAEGFRLRIGSYRALYTNDLELIVIRVGPRGDVYK